MKHTLSLALCFMSMFATAQHVGIGIANPTDNLQVHGNNATSSGISFTNNATGNTAANGMRIGLFMMLQMPSTDTALLAYLLICLSTFGRERNADW